MILVGTAHPTDARKKKGRIPGGIRPFKFHWPWVVANRGATGRTILIVAGDARSPQTTWRGPAPGPASPWRELAPGLQPTSRRNHRGNHHCTHCSHCSCCGNGRGNASGSSGCDGSGCGNGYDGSCCGSHCSCDHHCNHCSSSCNCNDDLRPRPFSHRPRGRFQRARKRSRHREQQYDSSSNPPINLQVP
jgi:hypothetical protein